MSAEEGRTIPTMISTPSWRSVILVCGDCRKRGARAPRMKTKPVVAEARRAVSGQVPKVRVVKTTCLGLCPKRAVAIACLGDSKPTGIAAVATLVEVAAALRLIASLRI